jgi:hypothetical protein
MNITVSDAASVHTDEADSQEHQTYSDVPLSSIVYPIFRPPGIEYTSARAVLEHYSRYHYINYGRDGNAL